jgi:small GTP-binding protein
MRSLSYSDQVLQVKIVIIGEAQVGKSSMLTRYMFDRYDEFSTPTLGVSFTSKLLTISSQQLKLNVWDTAGQERFHSLTRLYSRDAQIVIMVYDITSEATFIRLKALYNNLLVEGFEDKVVLVLAGNKEDLVELEQVPLSTAKDFAESINALYFKTSAKSGIGIDQMFYDACQKYLMNDPKLSKDNFFLTSSEEIRRKKACCG